MRSQAITSARSGHIREVTPPHAHAGSLTRRNAFVEQLADNGMLWLTDAPRVSKVSVWRSSALNQACLSHVDRALLKVFDAHQAMVIG
ncbi:hypothetical protein [Phytohalomonas tamaricis]|uniref:hypothetical protein n=1 Tax=Phytohalomonas tamaricis TaxID=2081032 RepID=UPI000D0B2CB9|nr:hypothetical protein [Phytohalomonas tamaricis]